jgi:hypothetical protein
VYLSKFNAEDAAAITEYVSGGYGYDYGNLGNCVIAMIVISIVLRGMAFLLMILKNRDKQK